MDKKVFVPSASLVSLSFLMIFLCGLSSVCGQFSDERMSLLEFKESVSDSYGMLSSWNAASLNHCSWLGVSCNSKLRVSGIKIGGNFSVAPYCLFESELSLHAFGLGRSCSNSNGRLRGRLSDVLGNLTELRILSLPFNEFWGGIPGGLLGLKNLEVLDLEGNRFDGVFSHYEFSGLRKLRVLNLAFNRLFGRFPHSLSKCRGLRVLNLAGNDISGAIPGFISHYRKLRVLNLSFNQLVGDVPSDLGYVCGNLEHLDLSANFLKGEIPHTLGECSHLKTLLLSSNAISGVIPEELGKLGSLEALDVSRNMLHGPLPANLGNCTRLSVLVLSSHFNVLPGKGYIHPRGIGHRGLNCNSFEDSIPDEISALPNMKIIWAPSTNLGGDIPSKWGSCKSLVMVNLAHNFFTGDISDLFTACTNLQHLNLSSNMLSGRLDGYLRVSCMSMLDVGGNMLTGSMPNFSTDVCHNLPSMGHGAPFNPFVAYSLFFKRMAFSEYGLPLSERALESLAVLDLSLNNFTGEVPEDLTNLWNLEVLKLNGNHLSGKIPSSLVNMVSLHSCNLSSNDFYMVDKGMSTVCSIDLDNRSAPRMFDQPTGKDPKGQAQHTKVRMSLAVASVIFIGSAIAAALLALLITYCCLNNKRGNRAAHLRAEMVAPSETPRKVMVFDDAGVQLTYEGIVRATENFSRRNCIGSGGFGSTYKAEIAPGNFVAVKRLTAERNQGAQQFHAEVSTLGRIRHPHLITLIGYYCSPSEMFLIYNYLPGGNLDRFIRERETRFFDWSILHKIALHIASALCYLHDQCNPHILHRDIKPSNILLDSEYNAYLSDFGLSKIISAAETHATTRVAGTYGYISPEYALTGRVSNKADVYSYGVVLLELMSDKRVLDPSFYSHEDGFNIVTWAVMMLNEGNTKHFFTAKLWETGPRDKLVKLLHVAILCTVEAVAARPTMRQVVQRLKQLGPPT